jgi:hypothetical protein
MTGKFNNATEEIMHALTMDSCQDEESGDVQETGEWCALFRGPLSKDDIRQSHDPQLNEYFPRLSEYRDLRTMAGAIYSTDNNGFVYVMLYDDERSLNAAWQKIVDAHEVAYGPQEDDITIQPNGDVYQYGKLLFEVGDDDDRDAMIRAHMDREQFWPNVWIISDHGNAEIITI